MKSLEPIAHLTPEIQDLFKEKKLQVLKDLIIDIRPEDFAESWYRFTENERLGVFKLLEPKSALVLFESLEINDRAFLLKSLDSNNLAPLLEGVPATDVAETFHTLPVKMVKRMVSLVRKKDAIKQINLLMEFDIDSAGSLLHPEFIKLTPGLTSKAALSTIHSVSRLKDRKHLWALYVTSKEGFLLGAVTLEGLISSAPDSKLEDIMTSVEYFKTLPDTDQEHVASIFAKYDLLSMPVVDEENKLLGIILVDDIIDVIKQEATEDIAKMVGSRVDEFQERNIFKIACSDPLGYWQLWSGNLAFL